uniref:uncharacterized protein LOC122589233 n=1 Tax=Erigeron canadensis TaxID=72917 RepID=UPI001CB96269|nr:uncharacterized protein LOC122589233 [Erigeron canadensis]
MPSVEMRRTTRVFGARVLRSGRRLFPCEESKVIKHMRKPSLAVGDDWIELLRGGGGDGRGWRKSNGGKKGVDVVLDVVDGGVAFKDFKLEESKEFDSVEGVGEDCGAENRRWGVVYTRKRKRSELTNCDDVDAKFGKKFFRQQSRKVVGMEELQPSILEPDVKVEPSAVPRRRGRKKKVVTEGLVRNVMTEPSVGPKTRGRKKKEMRVVAPRLTRLSSSSLPPRTCVAMHRGLQKRRSSLRSRKHIGPSTFGHLKSGGRVVQDGVPFFPIKSNLDISSSLRRASFQEYKKLRRDTGSESCNASILVMEADRCYREVGAVITMEMSPPNQWFLVVKRNGVERYRVEARNVMRPYASNRVTHAIIWTGSDESWKLEFPNRKDWSVFKELYRSCSERSVQVKSSVESIIPVPRVNEVVGYAEEKHVPFKMPDSYISSRGDEVSRVLEKSDPVYDMDSGDDEWLNKLNDVQNTRVDDATFEKIIDAFERGIYVSPEDYSDITLAVDRCSMLAAKEALEAIYNYWMAKRKKKQSALVRVFQSYKPKNPEQLNIKAVLRKKRSFRQRVSQAGRGKQLTFLKVEEEGNAIIRVQEAEAAAERAKQVAIVKRQRAQLLMEVADLLTYKAAMALQIAEARLLSGSVDDTIDEIFCPVNSSGST